MCLYLINFEFDFVKFDFPLRAVELNLLAKGDSVVGWKEGDADG